jgi:hypothetical protein
MGLVELERLGVEHDAVVARSLLDAHVPVADVRNYVIDGSLAGVAPAAAGSGHESRYLSAFEPISRALAEDDLAAVGMEDPYLVARPVLPTFDAPRREAMPAESGREKDLVRYRPVVADAAAPAPSPACPRIHTSPQIRRPSAKAAERRKPRARANSRPDEAQG